ncbi:MAG TPA: serine/threonine-protein kinase [Ktedonobacteraceae bacterium]|nr:serine/threonine-protein kinase [Ktedonobacteraceae bacterium]
MSEETRKLGKYEMQSRLAQGGMGEVWKAFDSQLKRTVAIKLLRTDLQHDPEFTLRFEREAQLIAALRHPNIVQIHDFDITSENEKTVAYMVMDYVKGQTLADYIRSTSRKGNFPSAEDITYIFAITSLAMDYAHEKGMIHRDIKPANILLDQRLSTARSMGEPTLTDFGIARLQGVATGTVVGSLLGTPLYISPEQARGLHGDKRSDLYSLGIILYEMVTGVTPFRGETTMAILMQHLNEIPTPPALINPNIPSELSLVILKSIAKQPEDRYNSASDMTVALADALHAPLPERFIHALRANSRTRGLTATPQSPTIPSPLTRTPQQLTHSQPIVSTRPLQQSPANYTPPSTRALQNTPAQHVAQPSRPASQTTYNVPVQARLPKTKKAFSGRQITIFILLTLFVLIASTGITMLLLHPKKPAQTAQQAQNAGVLQVLSNSNQLHIEMNTVKSPQPGHTYYAWIQTGNGDTSPPHWSLAVQDNSVNAVITVPLLQSMLANKALFLITDETIADPIIPYTAPTSRLYYARLSSETSEFAIQACPPYDSTSNVCQGL